MTDSSNCVYGGNFKICVARESGKAAIRTLPVWYVWRAYRSTRVLMQLLLFSGKASPRELRRLAATPAHRGN
jgi:hypothetical protein